jgi:hypothetical protein
MTHEEGELLSIRLQKEKILDRPWEAQQQGHWMNNVPRKGPRTGSNTSAHWAQGDLGASPRQIRLFLRVNFMNGISLVLLQKPIRREIING